MTTDDGDAAVAVLHSLWFDGRAWLKGARLEDRVRREHTSKFHQDLAAALDAWAARDPRSAEAIVIALADDLLCEQLPESSDYPHFVDGPWVPVDRARADEVVTGLVGDTPDEAEQRALTVWNARAGRSDAVFFRCAHPDATAVALLDAELGLFFLDPG